MEKDITENKENMEKLQVDFKQLEVDAAKVMDEHEKLQVRLLFLLRLHNRQ